MKTRVDVIRFAVVARRRRIAKVARIRRNRIRVMIVIKYLLIVQMIMLIKISMSIVAMR